MNILTLQQFNARLYRHCAMVMRPRGRARRFKVKDFYVAVYPSGLVKIGVSWSPLKRLSALYKDAVDRCLPTGGMPELRAVVPQGGRDVEREMLLALAPERVKGEWFQGPLSSAVAAALVLS